MRRLAALALLTSSLLAACGSGGEDEGPTGSVRFRLDSATCTRVARTLTLFVDGNAVGTETLMPGDSSKTYTTSVGNHLLGATFGASTWPAASIGVNEGATSTMLLTC